MGIRLTATLTALGLVFSAGTAVAADRNVVQEALDQITGSPGTLGLQARVRDGHQRFTARSGTAELGTRKPVPTNGSFRAGSITKTFVSTVVLQLVGEGRIELDAPVDRYLPGLLPNQDITVRQVLQHTSGLHNFTHSVPLDPAGFEQIRYRHWEPKDLLALSTSKPLDFTPGTKWSYSNTNYVVAGLLIERVTGRPYERAVEQRVLKPLRLKGTVFPGDAVDVPGPHARGYWSVNGKPVDITRFNPSVTWAAGELITTTRDLDTFLTALATGDLLAPAQLAELTRTTAVSPTYGLGLSVQTLPCGTKLWGHAGGVPGYLSQMLTTPDAAKRLVVSGTTSPEQGNPPGEAIEKVTEEIFC